MHDDDGTRSRCHAAFEFSGVEVVGFRANVCENRPRSQGAHGAPGGNKGECWQQHFIASVHAARAQGQHERVRAGGYRNSVRDAAQRGDLPFQSGAFASQDKLLRGKHAIDGRSNLRANRRILRGQIKLRHRFGNGIELWGRAHRCMRQSVYATGGHGRSPARWI